MVIQDGAQLQLQLQLMFLRYMEVMRKRGHADWDDAVAGEIYHRLARLEWLEWEVRSRELEARNPTLTNERTAQLMIELPTLTESWYYIAFRTMRLIKRKCPELGGFEVIGITLTRNKLIEHDNGIYSANITIGGPGGPEIKGPRWDGQSQDWADPGMFANAAEFDRQLRDLLMPYVRTSAGVPIGSAQENQTS